MKRGWRWTQWLILFWGLLAYIISLPQKETYKKIILKKRADKLGLPPPPNPLPPGMSKLPLHLGGHPYETDENAVHGIDRCFLQHLHRIQFQRTLRLLRCFSDRLPIALSGHTDLSLQHGRVRLGLPRTRSRRFPCDIHLHYHGSSSVQEENTQEKSARRFLPFAA